MSNLKKAKLTEGPIGKTILKLSSQMFIGILSMVAFNLADTYFVSKLGTDSLAAMSFTFPVIMIIVSLALGLGIGASAVISVTIGEGDHHKVQRLTTDALSLTFSIVIIIVASCYFTIEPLFKFLGAKPELIPLIKSYMKIWYLGMPFVVMPMVGNNAIRATGDMKTPAIIMLIGVTVNIILDPLLIFGIGPFPRMEIAGAALTTVFARATVFLVAFWVLYHRDKMITFELVSFKKIWSSWKRIMYIGFPTAGSRMVIPISTGIITKLLATYGKEAVAGYGVATRVEFFSRTVLISLSSVIAPFVGQNWGAKKIDRVKKGVRISYTYSWIWGVIMFVGLGLGAKPIASIFSDNPAVISVIVLYLWIVPISYAIQGMLLISVSALNVLNKPLQATGIIIFQMLILYIPLALLGSHLFQVKGIFGALSIVYIIGGIIASLYLKQQCKNC